MNSKNFDIYMRRFSSKFTQDQYKTIIYQWYSHDPVYDRDKLIQAMHDITNISPIEWINSSDFTNSLY
jgi:hypothetical protein